jgi:hypothetical protein
MNPTTGTIMANMINGLRPLFLGSSLSLNFIALWVLIDAARKIKPRSPTTEPPGKWYRQIELDIIYAQSIEELKQIAIDLAESQKIDGSKKAQLELMLNHRYALIYEQERQLRKERANYKNDTLR